ncbi:hypothetical protein JFL43_21810 [Viridibacillus sp. YIM B01967]|uniref:DUF2231 domain-containing protein n=1 Tax=Viridibacillus soli TaxID=2798301 RepID=A0ABS1HDB3_9BACL|nr:hypothetical protein [Viridibacillus soli]
MGVTSGAFALLTGEGAKDFAIQNWGRGIHDQVELHELFADLSMILFGIVGALKILFKHSIFKWNRSQQKPILKGGITTLIVILSISGISSLAITGDLGGKLVYENKNIILDNTAK